LTVRIQLIFADADADGAAGGSTGYRRVHAQVEHDGSLHHPRRYQQLST